MSSKCINIMLVDDNRIDLFVHRMLVGQMNISNAITEFLFSEDALEHLKNSSEVNWPDLILLDIYMPKINGFEFLDYFKKFPPHLIQKTKIIIVSSSLDEGDKKAAQNNPLVSVLFEKPLNTQKLKVFLEANTII